LELIIFKCNESPYSNKIQAEVVPWKPSARGYAGLAACRPRPKCTS